VVELTEGFVLAAVVGTSDAALAAVRAGGIDMVLLDVHLPGRDGMSTVGLIRTLELSHQPVVVLVSSYPAEAFDAAAAACGAEGYLPKDALSPGALTEWWRTARPDDRP